MTDDFSAESNFSKRHHLSRYRREPLIHLTKCLFPSYRIFERTPARIPAKIFAGYIVNYKIFIVIISLKIKMKYQGMQSTDNGLRGNFQ